MNMSMRDTFLRALSALVGEECWGIVGGEGAGSVISLDIGARTLRAKPINNLHLSDLVRRYQGAYALMLHCPWRIDSESNVVSGSHMSNANDGPMVRGYARLLGQKIKTVTCSGPAFDLQLDFENGHSLRIHCSAIGNDEDECYALGTPYGWFAVGLDGHLSLETPGVKESG
jgi:hypothetical protein